MTPAALDGLLSRACALGSTLDYVLSNMNGRIPCIIKWEENHRRTVCGPWNNFMDCADCWYEYRRWRVFDYELYEYDPPNVLLHIKEPMKGGAYGES